MCNDTLELSPYWSARAGRAPWKRTLAATVCLMSFSYLTGCENIAPPAPEPLAKVGNNTRAGAAKTSPDVSQAPLIVHGEARVVSKVPAPGQAPYRECLTFIKYRVVSVEKGTYKEPDILVAHWGMKEGKLMPAARYRVGDKQRLELVPLSDHPELERIMQADDTDAIDLTTYYARQ